MAALIEFVGIKVKICESFCSEERGQDFSLWLQLSQVTEKFTGVVEAESSYHTEVP